MNSANAKDSLNVNKQNTIDKLSFFLENSSSILPQLATAQFTRYHCLHGPFAEPSGLLQLLSTSDSFDTVFFQWSPGCTFCQGYQSDCVFFLMNTR